MVECKYCKREFTTMSVLKLHQNSTKYCLKLQNKQALTYKCKTCGFCFTIMGNLTRHQRTCKPSEIVTNLNEKIKLITNEKHENEKEKRELEKGYLEYKEKYRTQLKENIRMRSEYKNIIKNLKSKLTMAICKSE